MPRIETIKRTLYRFEELSDKAKDDAIGKLWDINLFPEWYDSTYQDAAVIGLRVEEFDLDRGAYLKGSWTMDGEDSAIAVLRNHGGDCDTAGVAYNFLRAVMAVHLHPAMQDAEASNGFTYDADAVLEKLEKEYRDAIREEYLSTLWQECEYLTSREAIIESIEANGYEFTEKGDLA